MPDRVYPNGESPQEMLAAKREAIAQLREVLRTRDEMIDAQTAHFRAVVQLNKLKGHMGIPPYPWLFEGNVISHGDAAAITIRPVHLLEDE